MSWPGWTRRVSAALAALIASCSALHEAAAQGTLPNSISKQFEAKTDERARDRSPLAVPTLPPAGMAGDTASHFVLKSVLVAGATAVSRAEIGRAYEPFVGRVVGPADLLTMAEAGTALYARKGYALSRAFFPPQDIKDGSIQLQVVEGYIEDVVLTGGAARSFGVDKFTVTLTKERPLRLGTLERTLLLLGDLPGVRIKDTVIEELGQATGRFRLTVHLETWRVFGSIDLDNRGTPEIGPLRTFATTALNSVLVAGDVWVVDAAAVPQSPQELAYLGGLIELPVNANGVRAGVRAYYSDIRPDDARRRSDTRLLSEEIGFHISLFPVRTRETSLKLTGVAGLRRAQEYSVFGTSYDDRLEVMTLVAELQWEDRYRGSNYLTMAGRAGHVEAPHDGLLLSRFDAEADFGKVFWTLTRQQSLFGPWSAVLSTSGQLASTALALSEQFSLGGPFIGRAFEPGALSGDAGLAGLLEMRFDQKHEVGMLVRYQLYGFVDGGVVWNRGGFESETLASYGAGVRFYLRDDYRFNIELASAIATPSSLSDGAGIFFSLSRTFTCGSC
jgi:hemolysin activation/secretion protein